MKLDKRIRNPYFWVGILGVILTALQVEASSLTTWASVGHLIANTVMNPYLLVTTAMAVLGVLIDPSTAGLKDTREIGHLESMNTLEEDTHTLG